MNTRGELRINPGSLELPGEAVMQLVVIHSEPSVTAEVLRRAVTLAPGLWTSLLS